MAHTPMNHLRRLIGKTIEADLKCGQCGYDLRGLRYGTPCPECGTPVSGAAKAKFHSTLTDAPVEYLSQLRNGCAVMLLSGVGMVTLWWLGRWLMGGTALAPLFPLPAAMVWVAGVWMVTQPRRPGVPEKVDHRLEWKKVRDVARWSQLGWVVACVMYSGAEGATAAAWSAAQAAAGATPNTPIGQLPVFTPPAIAYAMNWIGALAFGGAFLGVSVLMIYLALLAYWASDTTLAERLNLAALAVGAGFVLAIVGFGLGPVLGSAYTGMFQTPSAIVSFVTVGGTFLAGFSVIILFIGVAQGAWALVSFVNMSRWALRNSQEQAATDRRRSENINRRILGGQIKPSRSPRAPEPAITRPHVPADAERRGVVTVEPPASDVPTFELAPEPEARAVRHEGKKRDAR